MFRKLQIQMTAFSALITSAILITMTLICLFIAESGARKNSFTSFSMNAGSCIIHLEGQATLSHQWLLQAEKTYGVFLELRDNGRPLFFGRLHPSDALSDIFEEAETISLKDYAVNLNSPGAAVTKSAVFAMKDYYACTALIPRSGGTLSLIVLCPLETLNRQLNSQRLSFAAAVLLAILALSVFSWFFTRRMIRPLEESRQRQTEFIASASHELRSPLTVIQSCASALEHALFHSRETPGSEASSPDAFAYPEIRNFLSVISRESSRMARLISDMLTLASADSRSWKLNAAPCELDTLLLETYDAFTPAAREKKLRLKLLLPEEPIPSCLCDSARISQVLSILLDNAFSCVPPEGTVTLSLQYEHSRFLLQVSDNGPGIPDAQKEAVFRRFQRLDASRTDKEHFGLGLSIAREILSLHRGTLTVTDTPGGGATFRITLP